MKFIKNNKGASEIFGYTLIILIVTITVGLIMSGIMPVIGNQQTKQKFELSKNYIDLLDQQIKKILISPNNSTSKINLNLDNIYLLIDSNQNKIEIYQITNNNIYKEKHKEKQGNIYTYKDKQKLIVGIEYENINLISDELITNKQIELYITKIEKNTLKISTETIRNTPWYDKNWKYRKEILLDSNYFSGDLNNFTIPINIIDKELGELAKENGRDILFTDDDGVTKLKREIDYFSEDEIYFKKIIIDSNLIEEDLIDFPLLISLTDINLSNYTREDGMDIYFTLGDGLTKLEKEIENYNFLTGELNAWVKIPYLSSTKNTELNMFFGDKKQRYENSKKVWTDDYITVHHLNEFGENEQIDAYKDSTKNNFNGTYKDLDLTNDSNIFETGKIGFGNYFDGNEYIDLEDISKMGNWSHITASAWVNWNGETLNNYSGVWYKSNNNGIGRLLINPAGKILYENGNGSFFSTNSVISKNNWHLITYKFNNQENKEYLFVDGKIVGEQERTEEFIMQNNTPFKIGFGYLNNSSYTGFGKIDEVKISNISKTNNWIKTEYLNQNEPLNFYTISKIKKAGKQLIAYVKVPQIYKNLNKTIILYFGNENGSEVNDKDAWDKYHQTVLHFTESPNMNILGYFDSTKNKHNGFLYNFNFNEDSNTDVQGVVGKAVKLDGDNDYISITQDSMKEITYCMWINKDFEEYKRATHNSESNYVILFTNPNFGVYLAGGTPTPGYHSTHGEYINPNETHYICWSYNKEKLKLYVDDHKSREIEVARNNDISNTPLVLGKSYGNESEYFKGIIDELKISNTIRTDDWLKTEYLTLKNSNYLSKLRELEINE